jgi:putative transposase
MIASGPNQALERFRIIRPCLEEGVSLAAVARHHGIPLRTIRRWVSHYRTGGLAALMRAPRADKGSRRALSPALQDLVEALALARPRRSVAAIHRTVTAVATDRGETPPGYATVYALVRALDPALLTLAHDGVKAYSETYDLLYRREVDAPNAVWQADHTLLDLLVLDDKGLPARPWLSVIIDDYSRALAGYFLSCNAPAALQTALALHQAIWRKSEPRWTVCGIPAVLYTDHGSDFTSRHIEQVCAALKIRLVFSLPGKPRGRGRVERFFETVNQQFLSDLPGYAPAGQAPRPPALTLSALDHAFRRFVLEDYHQHPHSTTGVPPQARWNSGGFLPHMPESLEHLDLLLLTVAKPRQVHQDGIRFPALVPFRATHPSSCIYAAF